MPPDDKRSRRAPGSGLPDLDADAASDKDDLQAVKDDVRTIKTQVGELLARSERNKRGRPRDTHADVLGEVSDAMEPAVRKAFEHAREQMTLGILVAVDSPAFEDLVIKELRRLLPVAIKAGAAWHYKNERKVKDAARAMRSGTRRRRDKTDPSD